MICITMFVRLVSEVSGSEYLRCFSIQMASDVSDRKLNNPRGNMYGFLNWRPRLHAEVMKTMIHATDWIQSRLHVHFEDGRLRRCSLSSRSSRISRARRGPSQRISRLPTKRKRRLLLPANSFRLSNMKSGKRSTPVITVSFCDTQIHDAR